MGRPCILHKSFLDLHWSRRFLHWPRRFLHWLRRSSHGLDASSIGLDALGLALDAYVLALVFLVRLCLALLHQLGCQIMRPFSESSALGVPCLPHVPCMQITLWDVTLPRVVSVQVAFQRWCVLPHPYTSCMNHSLVGSLPTRNWGCGLKTTFLYLSLLFEVSWPKASTPLLCRLLLCRLLHSHPYP